MGDAAAPTLGRGQCCMLCSNQLYSAGFNVYQARTYHGEKSFFDKLIQLTYSKTNDINATHTTAKSRMLLTLRQ